ncbi:MAG: MMPL family transporter [Alphaproteobacteria bacterium]
MVEWIMTLGARNRLVSLVLLILITLGLVSGLPNLQIDTSYDSLISENDPGWPGYRETVAEFGSDNTTIIYIRDTDLWTEDKLLAIEDTVVALESLDAVENVESLFSVLNIRDKAGFLDMGQIMYETPFEQEEIDKARENALYSPLVRDNFISKDGTTTAINVTIQRDRRDPKFNLEFHDAVEEAIAPLREELGAVFQVGPPRLNVEIERGMFADMQVLSPISTLILITSIIFFLRTSSAAVIPIATSLLSVAWTFGFMGHFGLPLTLLTAIVPSLVIVIGSTEDTHLLSAYLQGLDDEKDRRRAIRYMAKHVGLPIFITSFTTAIGFGSNALNDIPLIRDFAFATAFAMIANLVCTVLIVPLLLTVIGPKQSKLAPEGERPKGIIGALVLMFINLVENHGKVVMIVTASVVVVFAFFATTIKVSNDPLSYFRGAHPIVEDANQLHEKLSGMQVFYLTLKSEREDAFLEPEFLKQAEETVAFLREQRVYDKVISLPDHLALVNREMNGADPAFHTVPDQRPLVEQYMLMFQRDDLERYISADNRRTNIVVRHNLSESSELNAQLARVEAYLARTLDEDITYQFSGENLMINRAAESLFGGQVSSLAVLLVVIFVIIAVLFTSPLAGLVSLVPNAFPVIMNFGLMGMLDIPLNPGTATVAAIAIGIAIDDTTHLFTRYNDECRNNPDHQLAVRETLWSEAVPVISTSVSLALGFGIMMFSNFAIVAQFGALAALTMIYAMLADLLLTPIILRRLRLVGIWDVLKLHLAQDVVRNSPIFRDMSQGQIKKAVLLSEVCDVDAGTEVIREGQRDSNMYVVLEGEFEALQDRGGATATLGVMTAGEAFGEIGYLGDADRTATIRAKSAGKLLALDAEQVSRALRFYPRIASRLNHNISRVLASRLIAIETRAQVGESN